MRGIGWRIGDGNSVPLGSRWIPEGYELRAALQQSRFNIGSVVSDYINDDGMWNAQDVVRDFCPQDANCILGIPLPIRQCSDRICWWPNKEGKYTVRSGYWLGSCEAVDRWQERLDGQSNDLWQYIWRMKAPPKLKNFAWRVNSETLPVKSNLFRRRVVNSAMCDRCGLEDESIWHVLVSCPEADVAWAGAESLLNWCGQLPFVSLQQAILDVVESKGADGFREFILRSWVAWTCRNKVLFEPGFCNLDVVRIGLERLVKDYLQHQHTRSVLHMRGNAGTSSSASGWSPPRRGFLKLNVDAGIFGNEIGMGVVCRDFTGGVLLVGSRRCLCLGDILVAELYR